MKRKNLVQCRLEKHRNHQTESEWNNRADIEAQQPTSGLARAGVYARRNICGNLEVCRPPEHLCNPRPRQAAPPLAASGESVVEKVQYFEKYSRLLATEIK
jgi:hypothetical protein